VQRDHGRGRQAGLLRIDARHEVAVARQLARLDLGQQTIERVCPGQEHHAGVGQEVLVVRGKGVELGDVERRIGAAEETVIIGRPQRFSQRGLDGRDARPVDGAVVAPARA